MPCQILRSIPINIKGYLQPFLYGLVGGLAAAGFQLAIKFLEWLLWTRLCWRSSRDRMRHPSASSHFTTSSGSKASWLTRTESEKSPAICVDKSAAPRLTSDLSPKGILFHVPERHPISETAH